VFIATFVAAERLTEQSLVTVLPDARAIEAVEAGRVYRVRGDGDPTAARRRLEALQADIFVRDEAAPAPRFLVADMD
jgi:hypothetical protein